MKPSELHDYIERASDLSSAGMLIAEIDKVYTDTAEDDPQLAVDAYRDDLSKHFREIPVVTSEHHGHTAVPKEGDFALIGPLEGSGDGKDVGVYSIIHADPTTAPMGTKGDWRHEFKREEGENLYVEAERADHSDGPPEIVRIATKEDGLSDPTTEVAVDDSGGTTEVRISGAGDMTINVDGDVTINCEGSITVGDEGNATSLARADHTHAYSWTDSGGSGTTDSPSDPGTDTQVE